MYILTIYIYINWTLKITNNIYYNVVNEKSIPRTRP